MICRREPNADGLTMAPTCVWLSQWPRHNYIANLTYGGVSVGWGWTLAPTFCHNNTVSFNDIGHRPGVANSLSFASRKCQLASTDSTFIAKC